VVIAVDDSKSMADSGCGGFALEALTLMCRAMARLEVGELGVVRFGGPAGVIPLQARLTSHPAAVQVSATSSVIHSGAELVLPSQQRITTCPDPAA